MEAGPTAIEGYQGNNGKEKVDSEKLFWPWTKGV